MSTIKDPAMQTKASSALDGPFSHWKLHAKDEPLGSFGSRAGKLSDHDARHISYQWDATVLYETTYADCRRYFLPTGVCGSIC